MTVTQYAGTDPLQTLVRSTQDDLTRLLAAPPRDPAEVGTEVGRISAWLAAADQVLLTTAAASLPDQIRLVEDARAVERDLQRLLWVFDRHSTGDHRMSRLRAVALHTELRLRWSRYAELTQRLADELRQRLGPGRGAELAQRLDRAFHHAPTRPHPFTAAHPRLSRLAFRVEAMADRIRDLMDSRTPHGRATPPGRRLGLWGRYLLGVSEFEAAPSREPPADR